MSEKKSKKIAKREVSEKMTGEVVVRLAGLFVPKRQAFRGFAAEVHLPNETRLLENAKRKFIRRTELNKELDNVLNELMEIVYVQRKGSTLDLTGFNPSASHRAPTPLKGYKPRGYDLPVDEKR